MTPRNHTARGRQCGELRVHLSHIFGRVHAAADSAAERQADVAQKLTSLDPANAGTLLDALQADMEALVAQGHDAASLLLMCGFSADYEFDIPSDTADWCDDVDSNFEWAGTLVQALHATAGFPRFFQDATNPDTKLGYNSA